MRLLVTAELAARGARRDLICEFAPDTTVGDLARHLAAAFGAPRAGRPDNVVDLRSGSRIDTETPSLFLGDDLLDPDVPLGSAGIRQGAIVGVGGPSGHRDAEPVGPVEIRVTSGAGAGSVTRLAAGRATIGSAPQCTIRLAGESVPDVAVHLDVRADGTVTIAADPATVGREIDQPIRREPATEPIILAASSMAERKRRRVLRRRRRPTELELGDRVDPLAPLPLVRLERKPLDSEQSWEEGQELGIGPVLLERAAASGPDASLSPAASRPELDYNRPPRLQPAPGPREFSLPAEPGKPDKMPIPFLMLLAPVLMSGTMYFITRSPYTLLMAGMSPMMMLMNVTGQRGQQRKRHQEQVEDYQKKRVAVEEAAVQALSQERGRRRQTHPDPAATLLFATGPRARLWERRKWDADFLALRLGTTDLASEIVVKDPTRAEHEGPLRWTAADVPVSVSLPRTGVVGFAGAEGDTRRLAAWLVAQTAVLHSPTDAQVFVFTDEDGGVSWDWAKWLPHLRLEDGSRAVRIASDEDSTQSLAATLLALIGARRDIDKDARGALSRVVVVLDGARALRMRPGMTSALKNGPALGVNFLCLDRTVHELPEECRSVVEVGDGSLSVQTTEEHHIDGVRADVVDDIWLDRLARALSPIRDVSTEDLSSTLPTSSRLLDILNLRQPSGEELLKRWSIGGTTRAIIGEGLDGEFAVDVRADGPHGLIAGTTGSGKSELLQTIIASLAVGNRPDEFTFVLIDYKGGAAFMDCAHLPHTVGMVTDLDGHLTTRALESLRAELHHREHQLARARAKDIEDYLAGRKPGDEPMPRLLIVIDEFAALVAELPDFVTGLVDVARRGRSLGVHLILATQRPAGVVSAEIKSNTNLRIALRVTDAGDSQDVIESAVAAEIAKSTPGRAYARLGASSLMPFQSARVGGRPTSTAEQAAVQSTPFGWDSSATAGPITAVGGDDVEIPTDLATLVSAIRDAHEELGIGEMRKPWIPPLPDVIGLDDLAVAPAVDALVPPVPIGMTDLPGEQRQDVEFWDLENAGHLMIAGQSRTGRSSALRTIAGAIARQTSPADVHIYGIDAGNNALLPLVSLPHVGAVVTRLQGDRMNRLFDLLQREVTRRQQALAEQGFADIREQRRAAADGARLPYLVVLLDRLEGFVQAFEAVDGGVLIERLHALLQEGAGVGVRFVIGGDRSGVLGRISMLVEDRIVLSMPDASDYTTVGLNARQIPAVMGPGRAFRAGERPREVQLAMLDSSAAGVDQVRVLQEIAREASARWSDLDRALQPARVDDLPTAITAEEAAELEPASASPTFIPVGVGGDTLALHGFDTLANGPGFLIAGPPRSGRSTTLMAVARAQAEATRELVVIAPRVSPLRDLRRAKVLTGAEPVEELRRALTIRRPHTVLIDDFDVIGHDSPAGTALVEIYQAMRDTANAMVVAGGIDELTAMYRGLPAEIKKGRTGLLLAPRSSTDGEVLNARLPRSVGTPVPAGRGILTTTSGWMWVQVPKA